MSGTTTPGPIVDQRSENPRMLRLAGGLLFVLGLIAAAMAYLGGGDIDRLDMVLYAAVLLALGYPLLLYAQALKKIAALEARLAALERRARE